ncbi:hypothetical protein BRADO1278 [Bradyrhizobium sp. ORS 278]|uniref:hypothetical protein n=1 Tax=Bradyrhizobium sp. (strain ORS 278) TaxID=114615 RepID=UPI0001507DA6|nr:hypothetical protein [Bradyrhizobium sp. ORS 278]CAL75180.1 hypothetical protein BRADO1278 [Bradyrhizobium sp. ORS 278]
MTLIAGFALPHHPLADEVAVRDLARGVLAVMPPAAADVRASRYKTAVRWCSTGPFLPVPWQLSIDEQAFTAAHDTAIERLRLAVADIELTVEFAFCINARTFDDAPQAARSEAGSAGRAYLRQLQKLHPSHASHLARRLSAAARDRRFDLPSVRVEQGVAEGILSCAAIDAAALGGCLIELASAGTQPGVVEGPLPPFATAARVLASIGLPIGRHHA